MSDQAISGALILKPEDMANGALVLHNPIMAGDWGADPKTVRYFPDNADSPIAFALVRDGEERPAVLVERAVYERLQACADAIGEWLAWIDYPGSDRETVEPRLGKWFTGSGKDGDAVKAFFALRPGDIDPLP